MSNDIDAAEQMTLFSLLPDVVDEQDLADWASAGATSLSVGTDWAEDDAQLERAAFMLETLVGLPRLPAFDLRFLFLAHPSLGASLWHVALIAPEGDEEHALTGLVGADVPASLESTLEWFDVDGSRVCQRIAMDDLEPVGILPTGDQLTDRVLQATVGIAVRRELPGLGVTDVLAHCSSTNLESLFASLEGTRILLTSHVIPDEVAAAAAL